MIETVDISLFISYISLGEIDMERVMVMSCGAIGWMPPQKTGGMLDRYVLRCFTGDTMHTTDISERELQRFLDNPERRFAKAANLPSNCSKEMYCQVLLCYQEIQL